MLCEDVSLLRTKLGYKWFCLFTPWTREQFITAHLHEPKIDDECVEKEEEGDDVADEADTGDDQGARAKAQPKEGFHFWETHSSLLHLYARLIHAAIWSSL